MNLKSWLNKQVVLYSVLWQEWDSQYPTDTEGRCDRQCMGKQRCLYSINGVNG
ncbi:TPA: hypothetical protein G8K29_004885 [Salmonella enterica]|nr:hypothetical protein [Salmonella enterica subsp. enterica serovar Reading]HAF6271376.1 hypothetical protein [Salmonella enterica]